MNEMEDIPHYQEETLIVSCGNTVAVKGAIDELLSQCANITIVEGTTTEIAPSTTYRYYQQIVDSCEKERPEDWDRLLRLSRYEKPYYGSKKRRRAQDAHYKTIKKWNK